MKISPLAGRPPPPEMLLDVSRLVTAYYTEIPDPSVPAQRVAFGTSGHRGSAFETAFNEWHVLAISEAICRYRRDQGIDGPLFLGLDTHALSVPARATALEVLAANGVDVMLAEHDEYTPTPVVSHAILGYNRGRKAGLADGTVWTTDKDGIVPALLAAEITARAGRDPGEIYEDLTREFGEPVSDRVEAPATAEQKRRLAALSPKQVPCDRLAGEAVQNIVSHAPGNDAPIGGVKVIAASGWFAARPSGTEDIYRIYAESFRGTSHLLRIVAEAQAVVDEALRDGAVGSRPDEHVANTPGKRLVGEGDA
jgi:phosphoglucomutase